MKYALSVTILLLALFTGVSCHPRATAPRMAAPEPGSEALQPYKDADAYDVYAAVLNQRLPSVRELVIVNSTVKEKLCFDPAKESDEALRAASLSYVDENAQSRRLLREFPFERRYSFITPEERSTTFKKGVALGWQSFRKEHPNAEGFVELSAVGFSPDRSTAVVYEGYHCGGLCGGGGVRVFQKRAGSYGQFPVLGSNSR